MERINTCNHPLLLMTILRLPVEPAQEPDDNGNYQHNYNYGCPHAGFKYTAYHITRRQGCHQDQCRYQKGSSMFHAVYLHSLLQMLCRYVYPYAL